MDRPLRGVQPLTRLRRRLLGDYRVVVPFLNGGGPLARPERAVRPRQPPGMPTVTPLARWVKLAEAVLYRLGYLRYFFHGSSWRWLARRLDFAVDDHFLPWAELHAPKSAMIHPSASFRHARNIKIGSDTRIHQNCVLWASANSSIKIGDFTGLGPGTMIFSSNHRVALDAPYCLQPFIEKPITIGRDVWVGAGCVIVAGVTIGDHCVIAAGSVVTRDVPSSAIAAGVPARVIGSREEAMGAHEPGRAPGTA